MKYLWILFTISMLACNQSGEQNNAASQPDTSVVQPKPTIQVYANERFRNVTVEQTGVHEFRITGMGQIFEANFNWVVEDGHEELASGFHTTDAGAPEWGNFSFTVNVSKRRENSTLILILFEISAKDGSRQHELPIKLY